MHSQQDSREIWLQQVGIYISTAIWRADVLIRISCFHRQGSQGGDHFAIAMPDPQEVM
jgi:hypothetical protein